MSKIILWFYIYIFYLFIILYYKCNILIIAQRVNKILYMDFLYTIIVLNYYMIGQNNLIINSIKYYNKKY